VDSKTKQRLLALALALVVALVSWAVKRAEERRHPPQPGPAPADTAPPPHPPGQGPPTDPAAPAASPHLLLGNPSNAVADATRDPNNYLMTPRYFALSYNRDKGGANWVSWRLQRSDLGPADRSEFRPDATLPSPFRRTVPRDYTNSGFDRGHLCPRSDRTATQPMADSTFLMTNIVPQAPHLNQRAWNDLEEYTRNLLKPRTALYVVAGVEGVGGEGSNGRAETIAGGKVTVPARCWKVIVVVEDGTGTADDLGRVTEATRVIAVTMPNDQSVGHGWAKYRVSVAEVEKLTGYTFLDRVPPAVASALKEKVDDVRIPPVGKSKGDD
jgi:endonuclease G